MLACIPFSKPVIDSLVLVPQIVPLESTGEGSHGAQNTLSSIFHHKGWTRRSPLGKQGSGGQNATGSGGKSRRYGSGTIGSTLVGTESVIGGGGGTDELGKRGKGRSELELELEEAGLDWRKGPAVGLGGGFEGTQTRAYTGGANAIPLSSVDELGSGTVEAEGGERQSQSDREQASMESSEEIFRRDGSQERMIIRRTTSVDISSEPNTKITTTI